MKKLMMACVAAVAAVAAVGSEKHWVGNDSNFATASNWMPEGQPAAGDDLFFDTARETPLTINLPNSAVSYGKLSGTDKYVLKYQANTVLTVADAASFAGTIWAYRATTTGSRSLAIQPPANSTAEIDTLVATGVVKVGNGVVGSTARIGHVVGNGAVTFGGALSTMHANSGTFWFGSADPDSLIHPHRNNKKPFSLGDGGFGSVSLYDHNTVDVPEGTANVRSLWLPRSEVSKVVKTGAGTLALEAMPRELPFEVQGGAVKVLKPSVTIPENPALPTDPLLHLDPNVAGTVDYWVDPSTGLATDKVACWHDVRPGVSLCAATDLSWVPTADGVSVTNRPPLADVNGLKAVNFGKFVGNAKPSTVGDACSLRFEDGAGAPKQLSFRSGFIVLKAKGNDPAFFFGGENTCDWHANANTVIDATSAKACVNNGHWFLDGNRVSVCDYDGAVGTDLRVISFNCEDTAVADVMGRDRNGIRYGGLYIGEVVVYDRALSDDERRAGEAFLLKKWLGKEHPLVGFKALPTLNFAQGVTPVVDTDIDAAVDGANWSGELVKRGSGTVNLTSGTGITGFRVEGGVLTNVVADVSPQFILHLDASVPDTVEMEGDKVVKWADCDGGANFVAAENGSPEKTAEYSPTKLDAVSLPEGSSMVLNTRITTAKEVFLVWTDVSKASNGHFVLGDTSDYWFHRGENGVLFASYAQLVGHSTVWHDGETVDPTKVVPTAEEVHVTAFHVTDDKMVKIGTLARDRNQAGRVGGIRYCELLVSDKSIDDGQREVICAALRKKWQGIDTPVVSYTRIEPLSVAKGARFVCEKAVLTPTLGAEGGTAEIAGLKLDEGATLSAAASKEGGVSGLAVTGDVVLPAVCTVAVNCDGTRPKGGKYPILKGASMTLPDGASLRNWTIGGTLKERFPDVRQRLHLEGDTLYLAVDLGLVLILR